MLQLAIHDSFLLVQVCLHIFVAGKSAFGIAADVLGPIQECLGAADNVNDYSIAFYINIAASGQDVLA